MTGVLSPMARAVASVSKGDVAWEMFMPGLPMVVAYEAVSAFARMCKERGLAVDALVAEFVGNPPASVLKEALRNVAEAWSSDYHCCRPRKEGGHDEGCPLKRALDLVAS